MLNLTSITSKVAAMPDIQSMTFDMKTVYAILATVFIVFQNFFYEMSFLHRGQSTDVKLEQQIDKLGQQILSEHKAFRAEMVALQEATRDRFEAMNARIASTETTVQIMKANTLFAARPPLKFIPEKAQNVEISYVMNETFYQMILTK